MVYRAAKPTSAGNVVVVIEDLAASGRAVGSIDVAVLQNSVITDCDVRIKNEMGNKYGRLQVISRAKKYGAHWNCVCDCGKTCVVWGANLRRGVTKSCGCLQRGQVCESNTKRTKHGDSTPNSQHHYLYVAWQSTKTRAGKGTYTHVTVYSPWRCDYVAFKSWILEHLGERPQGYSLDRIDVYGNYEPENLRWATRSIQNSNKTIRHVPKQEEDILRLFKQPLVFIDGGA